MTESEIESADYGSEEDNVENTIKSTKSKSRITRDQMKVQKHNAASNVHQTSARGAEVEKDYNEVVDSVALIKDQAAKALKLGHKFQTTREKIGENIRRASE